MITPEDITNYNRTENELEEFLLFSILVAGKSAKTQAKKLHEFLYNPSLMDMSPLSWIEHLSKIEAPHSGLFDCMVHHKLGQYKRLDKAFRGILKFKGNLNSVTVEDLESVEGIGPKTARFFVLHSRPDQKFAVLDTHILKYLAEKGHKVPKSTPCKKKYGNIEKIFLQIAEEQNMSPADLDLQVWKSYSK